MLATGIAGFVCCLIAVPFCGGVGIDFGRALYAPATILGVQDASHQCGRSDLRVGDRTDRRCSDDLCGSTTDLAGSEWRGVGG